MSDTLQTFLVDATHKAMLSMEAAIGRLPLEKRDWSPSPTARTALDMAAEVAILNGIVTRVIEDRSFPADFEMAGFLREKTELARNWDALQTLLHRNTEGAVTAIASVPDADLGLEIQMPWGLLSLADTVSYPYWNMKYHEGQINYIASILGCLNESG